MENIPAKSLTVFIPDNLFNCQKSCGLYGEISDRNIYVRSFGEAICDDNLVGRLQVPDETISTSSHNNLIENENGISKNKIYIEFSLSNGELSLNNVLVDGKGKAFDLDSVLTIIYSASIEKSELLPLNESWAASENLKKLCRFQNPVSNGTKKLPRAENLLTRNLQVCQQLVERSAVVRRCMRSTLRFQEKNQLSAVAVDVLLGLLFLHLLESVGGTAFLLNAFSLTIETVVENVQNLIVWLMGIPAGLKLNKPLSTVLGKFFLYHLYLWRTYMDIIEPAISLMVSLFSLVSLLGLSLQLALLSDMITLATFHCYCFYIYATRLYGILIRGLTSTLRMFSGRKYNPLRKRVDSGQFTTEQLCVGMLFATTLLLLLPTTLVYYVVFLLLRLAVLFLHGTLRRIIWIINNVPLYSIVNWFLDSPVVSGDVRFEVIASSSSDNHMLRLIPVRLSFCQTLRLGTVPVFCDFPSVDWTNSLGQIVCGNLLYP